jgi:hypothetical protein
MSLRRDSVLFPQLHRVNISEMLQFAPLGFLGSTELSLRRASALPPQFHRVSVIVTHERFHPALALFNCIWFWHWKHHKVPNYVAESFPKCQLHQIMTISQIQFMVKFSKDASFEFQLPFRALQAQVTTSIYMNTEQKHNVTR